MFCLLLLQAIGTYVSLGMLNTVADNVLGLNVNSMIESPLNAALLARPSYSESTPRRSIVNGSVMSLFVEATVSLFPNFLL